MRWREKTTRAHKPKARDYWRQEQERGNHSSSEHSGGVSPNITPFPFCENREGCDLHFNSQLDKNFFITYTVDDGSNVYSEGVRTSALDA